LECYWDCPKKAWLTFWKDGTGYTKKSLNVEMWIGSMSHSIISRVLGGALIDKAIVDVTNEFIQDAVERGLDLEGDASFILEVERIKALVEGMVRGWFLVRWPLLSGEYDVVETEREHIIRLTDGVEFLFRPDALLERKKDKELAILEIKTSGWINDNYLNAYDYDSQTISLAKCISEEMGRPVTHVQIEVMYKGVTRRSAEGKKYYTPFLRGWQNLETTEISYEEVKRKGWREFQVGTLVSAKDWVNNMPIELLAAQYYSKPVYRSLRSEAIWWEQTIDLTRLLSLRVGGGESCFHGRFSRYCFDNNYHKRCQFLPYCYGEIDELLGNGWEVREPHHANEKEEL
jgi:hypothetical protein